MCNSQESLQHSREKDFIMVICFALPGMNIKIISLCHCLCLSSWGSRTKCRYTVHVEYKVVGILDVNHCEFMVQLVLYWSLHLFLSLKFFLHKNVILHEAGSAAKQVYADQA